MKHILLAGDSIFDNEHYIRANELSVSKHLIRKMPKDKISLMAKDGAKIKDVIDQINNLPKDVTHLIISAGGNDALSYSKILNEPCDTIGSACEKLCFVRDKFDEQYCELLDLACRMEVKTTVCTIYYPAFANPYPFMLKDGVMFGQLFQSVRNHPENPINLFSKRSKISAQVCAAEAVFNDVITFRANEYCIPYIDLRVEFYDEPDCYANDIEPSHLGGKRISEKIKNYVF